MAKKNVDNDTEYIVAHGSVLLTEIDRRRVGATVKESEVGAAAAASMVSDGVLRVKSAEPKE